jgi:ATPase subunit of ABC transporter with duplicated ATPase domains
MVELGPCRNTLAFAIHPLAGTVAIHPMLTVSQVSKSFAGRILFEDVSLQVNRGERIGLVGPKDAGKSTLFSLILAEASFNTARTGDVHDGCARPPRLHSSAADGAAAELFRDVTRAHTRRSLRRSVAALRIRSGRSCIKPAPTLTPVIVSINL